MGQVTIQFRLELGIAHVLLVRFAQLLQGAHQGFRYKAATVGSEMPVGIGHLLQGFGSLKLFCLRRHCSLLA